MKTMKCFIVYGLVYIIVGLIISSHCYAQWIKTYGGINYDELQSIDLTQDGGYITAGTTESFDLGIKKIWVIKLDSNGEIAWEKTYGELEYCGVMTKVPIKQTSDGGYILASYTCNFGVGGADILVLKLASNGDIVWHKTYGGNTGKECGDVHEGEYVQSILQTTDGGYILAGCTYSFGAGLNDFWILKLNSEGGIVWEKTYGSGNYEYAYCIQQTTDGGYYVTGHTYSFGAWAQFWILRLSDDGEITWQKVYGGTIGANDYPYSIKQTADSGCIVTGFTHSFGLGSSDIWILKFASNGDIEWQKTYGGTGSDSSSSIQQIQDGGYLIAGSTTPPESSSSDLLILKLASNGDVEWQKTYGGTGSDSASSIQQIPDGGYLVAGSTNSFGAGDTDFFVLKLNENGEVPDCDIMGNIEITVSDTSVVGLNSNVTPKISSASITNSNVSPLDTSAETSVVCQTICFISVTLK